MTAQKKDIGLMLAEKAISTKKKRNSHPEVSLQKLGQCLCCAREVTPDQEHCPCGASVNLADHVHQAYHAMEEAEARFSTLAGRLIEKARNLYSDRAEGGEFSKSLNVLGTETSGVMVTFRDAFCEIPIEKEPLLKQKLEPDYDQYFFQKRELSLVDPNDETIEFLMKKLGKEKFFEIFQVKVTVGTQPDMDRKQFELFKKVPDLRLLLIQHRPSVKARSEG